MQTLIVNNQTRAGAATPGPQTPTPPQNPGSIQVVGSLMERLAVIENALGVIANSVSGVASKDLPPSGGIGTPTLNVLLSECHRLAGLIDEHISHLREGLGVN